MRIISWNVNGIRAVAKKGLFDIMKEHKHDVFCFQETKAQEDQVMEVFADYDQMHKHANHAEKKGYSGVAMLSENAPKSVTKGIGIQEHDTEGRVLTADFESIYLVTVYTPNSGNGLKRLPYREGWDQAFAKYIADLRKEKPVVICGDLNVCHQDIDLARPKPNYNKSAGYTQKEIDGLDGLLSVGLIDSFRAVHPEEVKYSWWSYRAGARGKNIGWRIDYFLVDERLKDNIKEADILTEVMGSDHCPVVLELKL